MKRHLRASSLSWKKIGIGLLLCLVVVSACKKDYTSEEIEKGPTFSELQSWYIKNKTSGLDAQLPGIQPIWDQMSTVSVDGKIIYEIEVSNPNHVITADSEIESSQVDEYQRRNLFRLVIIKDVETGSISGNFMNILANSPQQDFGSIRYKNVGNFSGTIQYYQLNGKFNVGWHYLKGKIDTKYTPFDLPVAGAKVAVIIPCGSSPRYATICAGGGDGAAEYCTTSIVGYDTKMCETMGFNPDYGDGGGGGGGFQIEPDDPSVADKSLNKSKLPPNNTSDIQVASTCVFKTMEWINKYFGGDKTMGSIITDYANATKSDAVPSVQRAIDLVNNGVELAELNNLVDMVFKTTSTESITKSIDKGYPLMGSIATGQANIAHEVMITGYNNNGTVQYFDPETGQYNTKLPGEFSNVITIIGNKS